MDKSQERLERDLDALFERYRQVCPVPDASPGFMPGLWARIDRRRPVWVDLRRWAQAFVTVAAAASLLIAVLQAIPSPSLQSHTYFEVLAAEDGPDAAPFQDVALNEPSSAPMFHPAGGSGPNN